MVTPANFIPRDEAVKTSTVSETSTSTTTTTTSEAAAVAEAAEAAEAEEAAVEDNEVEAGVSRDHWREVTSFPLAGDSSLATTVTKYQSQLTGLTVVLARAESPIVNGYFCLATEVSRVSVLSDLSHFLSFTSRFWTIENML